MDVLADPPRQMVRLRGRSYVAFVFSPVVPIVEWLAEIDATLLQHDSALRDIYRKLLPLLQPPPDPPKRRIGFHPE